MTIDTAYILVVLPLNFRKTINEMIRNAYGYNNSVNGEIEKYCFWHLVFESNWLVKTSIIMANLLNKKCQLKLKRFSSLAQNNKLLHHKKDRTKLSTVPP